MRMKQTGEVERPAGVVRAALPCLRQAQTSQRELAPFLDLKQAQFGPKHAHIWSYTAQRG